MSLRFALAKAATRRAMNNGTKTRSVQTVPRLGTPDEMKAEAVSQLRARLAYQKELNGASHKSHSEEWVELWTWIKISILFCAPVCTLVIAKDLLFDEHMHRPEGPLPEYMSIRSKEFPWECGNCDIFDLACWKKCRAEK